MFEGSQGQKDYDECPLCGCKDKVIAIFVRKEQKKGKIAPDRIPCTRQEYHVISDPAKGIILSAPVVCKYFDNCAACGFEYISVLSWQEMTASQIESLLRQNIQAGIR